MALVDKGYSDINSIAEDSDFLDDYASTFDLEDKAASDYKDIFYSIN